MAVGNDSNPACRKCRSVVDAFLSPSSSITIKKLVVIGCRPAVIGPADGIGLIERVVLHVAKRQGAVN